jgi:lysophospholipase L1-like esterase
MTQDAPNEPDLNQTETNVKRVLGLLAVLIFAALAVLPARCFAAPTAETTPAYWIAPMKQVHARFGGTRGTFAQFGDSISFTMAFWAPLKWDAKNLDAKGSRAHAVVKGYMKSECWEKWKGTKFGSEGSTTIRWALENVDTWLGTLNPEAAVILFGSNDVGQMDAAEYEFKARQVIQRCLTNGTIVLLTTMPLRSGHLAKSKEFAEAARGLASELKVPLVDYSAQILQRRSADWDGSLPQFKDSPGDDYQVPTLMARDGVHPSNPKLWVSDYSEEGLRHNGYTLRNYLTLLAYAEVIAEVLEPSPPVR